MLHAEVAADVQAAWECLSLRSCERRLCWFVFRDSRRPLLQSLKGEDGSVLRLWTYRLPDGQIAVDSEIELMGGDSMHLQSSGLQQDGKPVRVVDARGHDADFRVIQIVAILNREVG